MDQQKLQPGALITRLGEFWRSQQIPIGPRISEEQVRDFEHRNGVLVPWDMLEYFRTLNGIRSMDNSMFRFWSLNEHSPVGRKKADGVAREEQEYIFADFLINSENSANGLIATHGR